MNIWMHVNICDCDGGPKSNLLQNNWWIETKKRTKREEKKSRQFHGATIELALFCHDIFYCDACWPQSLSFISFIYQPFVTTIFIYRNTRTFSLSLFLFLCVSISQHEFINHEHDELSIEWRKSRKNSHREERSTFPKLLKREIISSNFEWAMKYWNINNDNNMHFSPFSLTLFLSNNWAVKKSFWASFIIIKRTIHFKRIHRITQHLCRN